jgi:hypothetical protein
MNVKIQTSDSDILALFLAIRIVNGAQSNRPTRPVPKMVAVDIANRALISS